MAFAQRPKQKRVVDRNYRAWITQLPCVEAMVQGREVYGCDPAHVSHAYPGWTARGLGSKVDDTRCLPLTRQAHDRQHGMSEPVYWAQLGIRPPSLCADLQAAYPDVEKGADIIRDHAARAHRLPKLVLASDLKEPADAAPKRVTVHGYLSDAPADEFGNLLVIFPCLDARGRSTTVPLPIDPAEVEE